MGVKNCMYAENYHYYAAICFVTLCICTTFAMQTRITNSKKYI